MSARSTCQGAHRHLDVYESDQGTRGEEGVEKAVTAAVGTGPTGVQPSGTSRRLLVCGFILSTLFTTVLTLGGAYFVQTLQSRHVDRKEQIDQFRTLSGQMDGLVTAFQEAYLVGKPTDEAKRAL